MPVTNITELHLAAVKHLREQFDKRTIKQVEPYSSQLEPTSDRKTRITAPAVFVSVPVAQRDSTQASGAVWFRTRMQAYVITREPDKRRRNATTALALAEKVAAEIEGSRFGITGVKRAEVQTIENAFSGAGDLTGHLMQIVTWEQGVKVAETSGGCEFWQAQRIPHEVWLGYTPETGPDHIEDYDLIASQADLPDGT